ATKGQLDGFRQASAKIKATAREKSNALAAIRADANSDLKTTLLAGGILASLAAAVLAWLMSRIIVRPALALGVVAHAVGLAGKAQLLDRRLLEDQNRLGH
ncbi:methyl-accepting chemotaxis protein, partial [Rhizobium ruizarguesonis]